MQTITFNNGETSYNVPDDFHKELLDFLCSKQRRINQLEDAIKQAKLREEVAHKVRGKKQAKWAIPAAKHSRAYLYSLVGQNVTQCELYR